MKYLPIKFIRFDTLDLGKEYFIAHRYFSKSRVIVCKLVKVTAKGYNFLNINTNKCILKRHMYVNKQGYITLHNSIRIGKFKLELEGDGDRFINIEVIT